MRMECPEVFYTHEWAAAAARAFQGKLSPLLCLVYDSGTLCGIAALATREDSPGTASFLAGNSADYCDILSKPTLRVKVMAALLPEITKLGIHDLELANIPSNSATLKGLSGIAESLGFHLHQRPAYECRLIVFGTDLQRQNLFDTVHNGSREKRALKRIEKLGPGRLCHLPEGEVLAELTAIFSAQISRFLATGRVSPLVGPERRLLLAELTRRLGKAGWLKVSRLEIGGRPVAWNFGFQFRNSCFWYLPTFTLEYEDLSPGSHLLRLLIEECCSDPSLQRLDLGLGDEAYKDRYANASCPTSYVQLSRSRLAYGRNVVRYWSSRSIQRSPAAEGAFRRGRDISRGVRTRIRNTGLGQILSHAFRRASTYIRSSDEVLLFEAPRIDTASAPDLRLTPLDWQQIADIAMDSYDDPETLQYLMRCATRLRSGSTSGFVLLQPKAPARHILWIAPYDGFYLSEIKDKLEPSDPAAAMIFDCWTPSSHRGRGYYADALRLAAVQLQREQKVAWVFSSAGNHNSLGGILKAGFIHRFSLVRRSWLTRARVNRKPARGSV